VCALLGGLASCSGRGYLADRARDFAQCLEFDGSLGTGFRAQVGLSGLAQLGVGWSETATAGLRDGALGSWREDRTELGFGPLYLHEVDLEGASDAIVGHRTAAFGEPGFSSLPIEYWGGVWADRLPGDLAGGAHVFFVGASVRLRLVEVYDFLVGLVGVDPRGDDLRGRTKEELVSALRSSDPRTRRNADRLLRMLTGRGSPYRTYSDPDVVTAEQTEAVAAWEEVVGEERDSAEGRGP
jgi:hypothetical protein